MFNCLFRRKPKKPMWTIPVHTTAQTNVSTGAKSGTRMYVLAAGGPQIYPDSGDAVRFFASFHPVDPPN